MFTQKETHRYRLALVFCIWPATFKRLQLSFTLSLALLSVMWLAVVPENHAADTGRVLISGQISASTAGMGELVRFWITVSNEGRGPVNDVRLKHLDTPGFEIERRCWIQGSAKECGVDDKSPDLTTANDPNLIVRRLNKGESRTVWGDLVATRPNHIQSLVAIIEWQSDSETHSSASALLGRAASINWYSRVWTNLRDFIKDVGMPILLLLASLWFGYRQHTRDKAEQALQTERTQISETWNNMLPESHRLTKKHYIPMCANLEQMLDKAQKFFAETDKTSKNAQEFERRAFYHFMMFFWRARAATREIGGYYFKSRIGEELARISHQERTTEIAKA